MSNPSAPSLRRLCALAALFSFQVCAQTNILTNRYNQQRTAANLSETILTTSNVNTTTFGKLGTYSVDGVIYAQPLYVQGLTINGASHNVLFVATMHDVLYAFDADKVGSAALWTLDFRSATVQPAPIHIGANPSSDNVIADTFGIFGTPVIDLPNNRMFFVTHTLESGVEYFRLRNVNILTGALNASTLITASVAASGSYAAQTFIPSKYAQRPALELVNGQVWVAFGSRPPGDYTAPWEGWVMTYSAATLGQTGVFVTSRTNGNSVWQSGNGPAVDASGNVYYLTGNGGTYTPGLDLPESLLKFNGTASNLTDWYTPDSTVNNDNNNENYVFLNGLDLDLSCNGPVLIPGTDLVTFGSKTANVFLLHTGDLGKLTANDPQVAQLVHVGSQAAATNDDADRIVGMAYWQQGAGGTLFVWPGQDTLHAYSLNTASSNYTQSYAGTYALLGEPATALALSANGTTNGILWAPVMNLTYVNNVVGQPGILHAYNAANPAQELWNSGTVAADNMGTLAKFVPPVVVNGKVYMANSASVTNWSAGSVTVYGLKASATHIPPTVALSSPASGATYATGTAITLTATATASAGSTISSVAFLDGTTTLATITAAPYTFNWTNAAAGTHSLTAVATDNTGSVTVSTVSSITVGTSTTTTWTEVGVTANALAAGSDGTVLVTNAKSNTIWRYSGSPNNWSSLTPGTAMKALAVVKNGVYFGIGTNNNVYRYNGTTWIQVGVNANAIAAGSDGTVLVTNITSNAIWKYVADNVWTNITPTWSMKSLAVIKNGVYFGIGLDNNIYRYTGTSWIEVAPNATSIAAGSDGTVIVTSGTGQKIWQYVSDWNWVNITPATSMKTLAVVQANKYYGIGLDTNVYWY